MTILEYQHKACTLLKQTREQSGKTQKEMAALVGVTRQTINSWECGYTRPTMEYVMKWLDVMHVSGSILTDDDPLKEILILTKEIQRIAKHERK